MVAAAPFIAEHVAVPLPGGRPPVEAVQNPFSPSPSGPPPELPFTEQKPAFSPEDEHATLPLSGPVGVDATSHAEQEPVFAPVLPPFAGCDEQKAPLLEEQLAVWPWAAAPAEQSISAPLEPVPPVTEQLWPVPVAEHMVVELEPPPALHPPPAVLESAWAEQFVTPLPPPPEGEPEALQEERLVESLAVGNELPCAEQEAIPGDPFVEHWVEPADPSNELHVSLESPGPP